MAADTAIYIRWSTEDQGEGTTREVQIETCWLFIEQNGWAFDESLVFVDEGITGATMERPALMELRRRVAAGEIKRVVVYRVDRLSRSLKDAVALVLDEWEGRCEFRSATEAIETATPIGRAFFANIAMMAENERALITERMNAGREQRIRQGLFMGSRTPFGYRRNPRQRGALLPDEREAPLVRRMFADIAAGVSLCQLVRTLNQEGLRTRLNAPWTHTTVRKILRNETYVGVLVTRRQTCTMVRTPLAELAQTPALTLRARQQRPSRRVPVPAEPVRIETPPDAIPPLISRELFAQVQTVLDTHAAPAPKQPERYPYLITPLARCRCGSSLQAGASKGIPHYRCRNTCLGVCRCSCIPAIPVDQLVESTFLALFGDIQNRRQSFARLRQPLLTQIEEEKAGITRCRAEITRLEQRKKAIATEVLQKKLALKDLASLQQEITRRHEVIQAEIKKRQRQIQTLRCECRRIDAIEAALNPADEWTSLPLADKRRLLSLALVDYIRLWRDPVGPSRKPPQNWEVTLPWVTALPEGQPAPGPAAVLPAEAPADTRPVPASCPMESASDELR